MTCDDLCHGNDGNGMALGQFELSLVIHEYHEVDLCNVYECVNPIKLKYLHMSVTATKVEFPKNL